MLRSSFAKVAYSNESTCMAGRMMSAMNGLSSFKSATSKSVAASGIVPRETSLTSTLTTLCGTPTADASDARIWTGSPTLIAPEILASAASNSGVFFSPPVSALLIRPPTPPDELSDSCRSSPAATLSCCFCSARTMLTASVGNPRLLAKAGTAPR